MHIVKNCRDFKTFCIKINLCFNSIFCEIFEAVSYTKRETSLAQPIGRPRHCGLLHLPSELCSWELKCQGLLFLFPFSWVDFSRTSPSSFQAFLPFLFPFSETQSVSLLLGTGTGLGGGAGSGSLELWVEAQVEAHCPAVEAGSHWLVSDSCLICCCSSLTRLGPNPWFTQMLELTFSVSR